MFAAEPSDHPHGCGEKSFHSACVDPQVGSSPRVWGKDEFWQLPGHRLRIIPTGVGKRKGINTPAATIPDHPHGCGEKSTYMTKRRHLKDHPHGCGEKSVSGHFFPTDRGSSPRVWGKDIIQHPHQTSPRIIPTGVGKSMILLYITEFATDHPHGCGEKLIEIKPSIMMIGSSPRVWGKVVHAGIFTRFPRIIPTGVGKSNRGSQKYIFSTDHPHGCGEKSSPIVMPVSGCGSSPRVWGKVRCPVRSCI